MSTTIIYDMKVIRFSGSAFGSVEDHFLLTLLSGSNNCYSGWGANSQRSRKWGAPFFGTASDLIAQAISWGNEFEGNNSVWKYMGKTGQITPQEWIGKVRAAIRRASPCDDLQLRHVSADVGALNFSGKEANSEFSFHELLVKQLQYMKDEPGTSCWHLIKVLGPGAV